MDIDVRHIAKLAYLTIPEEKVAEFTEDMSLIMKMVENLPALESSGALLNPDDIMELRKDEIVPSYPREEILQNAPETAAGCFLVPKTVD